MEEKNLSLNIIVAQRNPVWTDHRIFTMDWQVISGSEQHSHQQSADNIGQNYEKLTNQNIILTIEGIFHAYKH